MSPETPNQTQSVVQHTAQGNDFWKLSSAEMNHQLDEEIKQIKETEAALVESEQKLRDLQQRIEDLTKAKEQRLRIREHHVIVAKLKKEDEALAKTST
jgi:septal ring factor EnvC (AmiA/AmiB activator)